MIAKERVNKLYDYNISKREYDEIIDEINNRVSKIWMEICKISKRRVKWHAFRNDVELGDGNGSTGGSFDPRADVEFIELGGDYDYDYDRDGDYAHGFYTRFLWTEDEVWKQEVIETIEANKRKLKIEKQKKKEKELTVKAEHDRIVAIIKSKLTKEELKYIRFK
jgi:hypothetical protein